MYWLTGACHTVSACSYSVSIQWQRQLQQAFPIFTAENQVRKNSLSLLECEYQVLQAV